MLTSRERAKLGAHYTPRAYVERLVQATIMDVLAPEWEAVQAAARDWRMRAMRPARCCGRTIRTVLREAG